MHEPQESLIDKLQTAGGQVLVGEIYYHYKNPQHFYTVLNLAITEWNDEPCVVYQAEYGDRLTFVRPLTSWLSTVEWHEQTIPRFALKQ